jgi:hypothetical protein
MLPVAFGRRFQAPGKYPVRGLAVPVADLAGDHADSRLSGFQQAARGFVFRRYTPDALLC